MCNGIFFLASEFLCFGTRQRNPDLPLLSLLEEAEQKELAGESEALHFTSYLFFES